ncbi:MAG: hypothetical protein J7L38_03195 [Thermoproteales archaeon]|nr:hypothetical protein [Thermoproteales archaeon]
MLGGLDKRTILSNETLLALADMEPPLVLRVLKLLNIRLNGNPLTLEELNELV